MIYDLSFNIDYSPLFEIVKHIEETLKQPSQLAAAVETAGNHVTQEWINIAGQKLKHSEGDYVRGIVSGVKYPFNGDPLQYSAINRTPYAKALEDGFQSFDMKKALLTSDKVRIAKDGSRYLIIPFRHGTPGSTSLRAMPKEIYNNATIGRREVANGKVSYNVDTEVTGAKNLRQSAITSTIKEGSIRGFETKVDAELLKKHNPMKISRNKYQWGDRLQDVESGRIVGRTLQNGSEIFKIYKQSIYEGMVRFQTNPSINRANFNLGKFTHKGINQTENTRNSSAYLTFRVMKEGSSGWIHPGLNAMNILKVAISNTKQPVSQMIGDAAKKDIETVLNNLPN